MAKQSVIAQINNYVFFKLSIDKSNFQWYNKEKKQMSEELKMVQKIIIGSRLKDTWGNQWFVVSKDKTGYILHGCIHRGEVHFTYEELKNWKIVSK